MTPEALAQIAYEAWWNRMWVSRGAHAPQWNELPEHHHVSWIAAAQAVKANVLSGFTKAGEGESNQP